MNRENLLHKWLNNESLTQEEAELLQEDCELKELVQIATKTAAFKTPDFDQEAVLKAIKTLNKPAARVKRLAPLSIMIRVAAVFAIVFAGYLYFNNLDTTVKTAVAEQTEFVLPDNSEVVLNGDSNIAYKPNDWANSRALSLTGEAYFKVAKGSTFTVHTDLGDVEVVGTEFNVYSRDSKFAVSCFEGVVSVSLNDKVVTLTKGMALQMEAGSLENREGITLTHPEWVDNESSFKDAPLEVVLNKLEEHYNIKVDASQVNLNVSFTGAFTHTNLEVALQSICNPLQMTYNVLNSEQVVLHEAN